MEIGEMIGIPKHALGIRPGDLLVLADHRAETVRRVQIVDTYSEGKADCETRVRIKIGRSWLTCRDDHLFIIRVPAK